MLYSCLHKGLYNCKNVNTPVNTDCAAAITAAQRFVITGVFFTERTISYDTTMCSLRARCLSRISRKKMLEITALTISARGSA